MADSNDDTKNENKGKQGKGANMKNPETDEHQGKKGSHARKSKYAKGSKN